MMILRAPVKPESVDEAEGAVTAMFSAINATAPEGIRYASCRLAGSTTFLILLQLEDGIENPLPAVAEFRAFQDGLNGWLAEPPVAEQASVVGSYNLF